MNRHIYRLVTAVLAAITIVSCNVARKSEAFRVLEDVGSYIEARVPERRPGDSFAISGSFLLNVVHSGDSIQYSVKIFSTFSLHFLGTERENPSRSVPRGVE